jgi:hypothetical protein
MKRHHILAGERGISEPCWKKPKTRPSLPHVLRGRTSGERSREGRSDTEDLWVGDFKSKADFVSCPRAAPPPNHRRGPVPMCVNRRAAEVGALKQTFAQDLLGPPVQA